MSMLIILVVKKCLKLKQPNCSVKTDTLVLASAVSTGCSWNVAPCETFLKEATLLRKYPCYDLQEFEPFIASYQTKSNWSNHWPWCWQSYRTSWALFCFRGDTVVWPPSRGNNIWIFALNALCLMVKVLSVMDCVTLKKQNLSQVDISHDDSVVLQSFF